MAILDARKIYFKCLVLIWELHLDGLLKKKSITNIYTFEELILVIVNNVSSLKCNAKFFDFYRLKSNGQTVAKRSAGVEKLDFSRKFD